MHISFHNLPPTFKGKLRLSVEGGREVASPRQRVRELIITPARRKHNTSSGPALTGRVCSVTPEVAQCTPHPHPESFLNQTLGAKEWVTKEQPQNTEEREPVLLEKAGAERRPQWEAAQAERAWPRRPRFLMCSKPEGLLKQAGVLLSLSPRPCPLYQFL